jgi:methionyl-tRNA formyltransferase
VYQPERVRKPEAVEQLRLSAPDAMVVVGYGQIIPQSVIDMAARHHQRARVAAAEIPRRRTYAMGHCQWRDAHRRHHHAHRRGLDTGDMLLKAETEIGPDETAVELGTRWPPWAPRCWSRRWLSIATIVPEKQDNPGHLRPHAEEGGWIDRLASAGANHPQSRPRICSRGREPTRAFRGQQLHIWKSRVEDENRCSTGRW